MSETPTDTTRLTPANEAEVVTLIRESYDQSRPLVVEGGGNFQTYGFPLDPALPRLSTTGLNRVIDYPSRDMTITIEAGMTFAALQAELSREGQRLPIDVPFADTATVGGALAANIFGSRGYQLGTWRDYLLGFSAVDGQGRLFKAGGRVVKNVAGYDLGKLMIGSHGTLGAITQMTLKVKPIPEMSRFLMVTFKDSNVEPTLAALVQTETIPVAADLLNKHAIALLNQSADLQIPEGNDILLIAYEGTEREVTWQIEKVQQELQAVSAIDSMTLLSQEQTPGLWSCLTEMFHHPGSSASQNGPFSIGFQASLKPGDVPRFCKHASSADCPTKAHTRSGFIRGFCADWNSASNLQKFAQEGSGSLVVLSSQSPETEDEKPFDFDPLLLTYMRKIKEKLDPGNILSPGKLFQ
ncbi:MAG: FAD-binding oxidoreductase [Planctomycetaceae bacterium]